MIDLRSDTVTVPSEAMRGVMAQAPVGDDVYQEDVTVNAFEEKVAGMLGHEAGVFTPTGSMANQLAIRMHARPGTELLVDERSHIIRAELGAGGVLSGLTMRTWRSADGRIDVDRIEELIAPLSNPYLVSTSGIAVENTHNFAGGTIQELPQLRRLRTLADHHGSTMHLDGARLWNAHVATGVDLSEYGRLFETVSVCFSKGLGAPVGSMLVGNHDRMAEARVWRKRFGGGMRQIGILAAAANYALDHHLVGLADDHEHARILGAALADVAGVVDISAIQTNIVMLELVESAWSASALVAAAKDRGVLLSAMSPKQARLVTHLGISQSEAREAGNVLVKLLSSPPPPVD